MTEGIDRMHEVQRKTFDSVMRLSLETLDGYIESGNIHAAEVEFHTINGTISAARLLGVVDWDEGDSIRKDLWDNHNYLLALATNSCAAHGNRYA